MPKPQITIFDNLRIQGHGLVSSVIKVDPEE